MCDNTQNLNETESENFFRYQIFPIPNPIPNFPDTESDTFSIPIFWRYTQTQTTQKMEKFRNREVSELKRHTLLHALRHLKPRDTLRCEKVDSVLNIWLVC